MRQRGGAKGRGSLLLSPPRTNVVLRCVTVHETLVSIVMCRQSTDQYFANMLSEVAENRLILDFGKCTGHATDGTSNMQGRSHVKCPQTLLCPCANNHLSALLNDAAVFINERRMSVCESEDQRHTTDRLVQKLQEQEKEKGFQKEEEEEADQAWRDGSCWGCHKSREDFRDHCIIPSAAETIHSVLTQSGVLPQSAFHELSKCLLKFNTNSTAEHLQSELGSYALRWERL